MVYKMVCYFLRRYCRSSDDTRFHHLIVTVVTVVAGCFFLFRSSEWVSVITNDHHFRFYWQSLGTTRRYADWVANDYVGHLPDVLMAVTQSQVAMFVTANDYSDIFYSDLKKNIYTYIWFGYLYRVVYFIGRLNAPISVNHAKCKFLHGNENK